MLYHSPVPPLPPHFPALPLSRPPLHLQRITVSAAKGNSSTYALGTTRAIDKREKSPPTCEESATLVKNMVEGKPNVEWTSDFRGFKSGMPIEKGTKVTTLDKQASKTVKNIKKQAMATRACEQILEEIHGLGVGEETRDARAAALEEAKEIANDPFAKAEAAKNFDPFDDPNDVAAKEISAKGTKLAGAKGGVREARTPAN